MKENEQNIKIEKYKNSYNSNYFKDVISPDKINGFENPSYTTVINNWYDLRLKDLDENKDLKERVDLLKSYLNDIRLLMNYTIELYKSIDRYDKTNRLMINRINIKEFDVLSILKFIKKYKISINLNNEKGYSDLSNKIKNYCLFKFDECIEIIEDKFRIKIYDSPINTSFKEVRNIFENAVKIIHDNSINISFKETRNNYNNNIDNLKSELDDIRNALKIKSGNINLVDDKVKKNIEKFVHLMEDDSLMNRIKTNSEEENKSPFYCKIGALFAQEYITKEPNKDSFGFSYFYKEKKFESVNKLAKHIQKNVLKTDKIVRQYISDTLYKNGIKNLYLNQTMRSNVIKYCEIHNINITNSNFKQK